MSDGLDIFELMFEEELRDQRILKPPYPWPGNKFRSVKKILDILPDSKIYAEPFGGSAAVLLSKRQSHTEVYNDRFTGVVDFYKCLREKSLYEEMVDALTLMEYSRETFNECKRTWKTCSEIVQRAVRWYYMVNVSFGGLGRNFGRITGVRGSAQVTQRIARNIKLFPQIHERMSNVQIENCSYESVLKDFDSYDTVFYLDPPYLNTDQGVYAHKWTIDDQIKLLTKIFECKGYVALSGYANKVTDSFPWDASHEWELSASMDTVTKENKDCKITKATAVEKLWIKEID